MEPADDRREQRGHHFDPATVIVAAMEPLTIGGSRIVIWPPRDEDCVPQWSPPVTGGSTMALLWAHLLGEEPQWSLR